MRSRSVAIWGVASLGLLLAFYAFSFGPVGWLAEKFHLSRSSIPGRALMLIYYPHFLLAAHQEWYFQYIAWWADHPATHDNYLQFKQHFSAEPN